MTKDVPGWAVIKLLPTRETRGVMCDAAPVLHIAVEFGADVAVGLFANWLYEKLKDTKQPRIRINRQWVETTSDGIKKAIKEEIEILE